MASSVQPIFVLITIIGKKKMVGSLRRPICAKKKKEGVFPAESSDAFHIWKCHIRTVTWYISILGE